MARSALFLWTSLCGNVLTCYFMETSFDLILLLETMVNLPYLTRVQGYWDLAFIRTLGSDTGPWVIYMPRNRRSSGHITFASAVVLIITAHLYYIKTIWCMVLKFHTCIISHENLVHPNLFPLDLYFWNKLLFPK